jgi:glucan phosphoethanolaminetransferase (alkaline phosphatase superfamily)
MRNVPVTSPFAGAFFYAAIQLISYKAFTMIQRIQSIWLLLASACAFAGFKFSFYSGNKLNDPLLHELNASSTLLIMLTTIAIGALALVTIFLFKQRTTQRWLCVLGILLQALLIFLYYRETTAFTQGNYALTAILQALVVLGFVLAIAGINKDSKIIKESDRLR